MEFYTGWTSLWKIFTTFWALVHKNTHPTHQGYKRHNYQTSTSNKVHTVQTQGKNTHHKSEQGNVTQPRALVFFNSSQPPHKNTHLTTVAQKYTGSAIIKTHRFSRDLTDQQSAWQLPLMQTACFGMSGSIWKWVEGCLEIA
jgi:hypothetical protein